MQLSCLLLTPLLALMVEASVTCIGVGTTATAKWTDSVGKNCSWTGTVGSNFGIGSNGGDYSCNGRCGEGCTGTSLGNVYTQDCFNHDVCSYFEDASGGTSDPNCGAAYDAAVDDFLLGLIDGCGQSNPSLAAAVPGVKPVCV